MNIAEVHRNILPFHTFVMRLQSRQFRTKKIYFHLTPLPFSFFCFTLKNTTNKYNRINGVESCNNLFSERLEFLVPHSHKSKNWKIWREISLSCQKWFGLRWSFSIVWTIDTFNFEMNSHEINLKFIMITLWVQPFITATFCMICLCVRWESSNDTKRCRWIDVWISKQKSTKVQLYAVCVYMSLI